MNSLLITEIGKLQLPHRFGAGVEDGWIEELLADYKVTPEDLAMELADDVFSWQGGGSPSDLVIDVIGRYLELHGEDEYSLTGEQYLDLFSRVQIGDKKNWRGLNWFTAKLLLSKARVIGYLQCEERYSSSQVVKVLVATESSLQVPFQAVGLVGTAFGASVAPPDKEVIDLTWDISSELGDTLFADATVGESCAIAAQRSGEFTPGLTLEADLRALAGVEAMIEPSWNYLQMLYWQALILEFYDHPASRLYEFVPRGANAKHAFKKFEIATDNPFLNNAKGTAGLSSEWALNRGGDDAHALVSSLALLEDHPHSASLETARILRAWIIRTLALARESRSYIAILDYGEAFDRLAVAVGDTETNTHGVIEQRIVDALSILVYGGESWKPSGLGDHVNATNTSRKKLGDVEFASVEGLRAVAIEAHGGRLTRAYVDSHNLSLERSIGMRLELAWSSLADASEWAVDMVFVAHQYSTEPLPTHEVMHGVVVNYEYINYHELRERALISSDVDERDKAFNAWVVNVLNSANVRQSVRDKAVMMMGDAAHLIPTD